MRARSLALLLLLPALHGSAGHVPQPAGLEAGHWVVVAVVDSGINPYHAEFRDAAFTQHPSTYVSGYPADAARLDLTLGAASHAAAVQADAAKWSAIGKHKLHWIPGTRIIGVRDAGDAGFRSDGATSSDRTPVLDDTGHGTAVASIAAGATLGMCPRCLLVAIEDADGLAWATQQPWIDVVVNSWGTLGNYGVPNRDDRLGEWNEQYRTREGAECGQSILFASGDGVQSFLLPEQTYLSNTLGPGWVLRVGAYLDEAGGRRAVWGQGKPVDILGKGTAVPAARHNSFDLTYPFSGTSASAPWVGGLLAETLRRARETLGDVTEGRTCAGQSLAEGAPTGGAALADGRLDRGELWKAFLHAAQPTVRGLPPVGIDAADGAAPYLDQGYGAVDATTPAAAHQALLSGTAGRGDVEPWRGHDLWIREVTWGSWDHDGDGARDPQPPPVQVAWSFVIP